MGRTHKLLKGNAGGNGKVNIKFRSILAPFLKIGVFNPVVCFRRIGFTLAGIPGTYDGRVDKFIGSVCGNEQFGVVQFNLNDIFGHNVRHVHTEHIGSLLFEQRCTLSLLFGRVEFLFGDVSFFYFSTDHMFADFHFHAVNCGPG